MDTPRQSLDPVQAKLERGKEVYRRLTPIMESQERTIWWACMYSVESGQKQTQGRHAGWISIDDCITTAKFMSAKIGYPDCTMVGIQHMVDRCFELGLLDTKHCDTNDGRIQQYVKTSSDYADYKSYSRSDYDDGGSHEAFANSWWAMDSRGEYHPEGPTPESREQFGRVIEYMWKGLQVTERPHWPDEVERDRLSPIVAFMVALSSLVARKKRLNARELQREDLAQSGLCVDEVFLRMEQDARRVGIPAPVRDEVRNTVDDALQVGFLTLAPSSSGPSTPRYNATNDYYDFLLYVSASHGFNSMLSQAREDERFNDLFEEFDAVATESAS